MIGKNTVIKKALTLRASKLADAKFIEDKEFFEQFGSEPMTQLNVLIE